jgi:hypothetical protein
VLVIVLHQDALLETYNFDKGNPGTFLVPKDKPEWELESRVARACRFNYYYTVGDSRHPAAIEALQPAFVPIIADNIEVDSVNCLEP